MLALRALSFARCFFFDGMISPHTAAQLTSTEDELVAAWSLVEVVHPFLFSQGFLLPTYLLS